MCLIRIADEIFELARHIWVCAREFPEIELDKEGSRRYIGSGLGSRLGEPGTPANLYVTVRLLSHQKR
jgi:hypothetical protein